MQRSLLAAGLLACAAASQAALPEGAGQYVYRDADGGEVPVYYYVPPGAAPGAPVVLVLHGLQRDAGQYRDGWIEAAGRHGLTVLAPLFTRERFRGANGYQLGNVFHAQTDDEIRGRARPARSNPPSDWSFALPDAVFRDFTRRQPAAPAGYTLYGHGAGAQFAQRYALFRPHSLACRIIAANPGWYTFPDREIEWPYGLKGVGLLDDAALDAALGAPLLLMLGEEDTSRGGVIRVTEGADAQGADRKARGENFFAYGQALAARRGVPSGWRLQAVAGAGHRNAEMVDAVAAAIQHCPAP
ncbi:hypothetical protein V8Z80_04165 [Orrella sp. JC864]|uniref:alpha/beta hydrolase n=1 Tax=Orrella sp. JC864 TaxID=3120298 RepID=UPI0030084126